MGTNQPSRSTRISTLSRSVRARSTGEGRVFPALHVLRSAFLNALALPATGAAIVACILFSLVCTLTSLWVRNQSLVAVGRVMDETRLVRVKLDIADDAQTQQKKEVAKQATPRVYVADGSALTLIIDSLENLPKTLATARTIDEVDPSIRNQFGLTVPILEAVKSQVQTSESGPEPSAAWKVRVRNLEGLLRRRPLLDKQTWQRAVQEGSHVTIKLVVVGAVQPQVFRGEVVNVEDRETLASVAQILARDSGFEGPQRDLIVTRITSDPKPTFTFDPVATAADQKAAADAVQPVVIVSPIGQTIFQRADVLTQSQAALHDAELAAYVDNANFGERWLRMLGIAAACIAITLSLTGYTALFCPRIKRSSARIAGLALLLGVTFVIACVASAVAPNLMALTATAPTILVAVLLAIAYDRRSALALALLHGLLVCVALRENVTVMAVMITGIACVVWTLKEIRDRNTLFRSSVITAAGVAIATAVFSLVERPLAPPILLRVLREISFDSGIAAAGTLGVGGATLFLLPVIERAFGVTTGLTLIDLRDPKQPLLRELQQRAAGTYTHSLNVASIAEAAAEAIGADSLLTYVGSLYHDIGKMNKPEYFVENQTGGPNKHDRLSPAMSLLIVVGHVKDGLELAREFRLPARIQHFIEAHHGTTLVEYFFHRAKKQALATAPRDKNGNPLEEDTYVPDEFEYRYPGPKPRSKEVAIVMIADAVESAARAMNDPTPTRIDALVRSIANKRLLDGQFDDCELTLRELNMIVESVSRTLTSMHHARIQYPGDREPDADVPAAPSQTQASTPANDPPAADAR